MFSLPAPFALRLTRRTARAEKTASSICDVRYFETLINTDLSIFNRARGASEFSSPRSGLFAPISACKLFDAISALAIPCRVRTILLLLCGNSETNSPFARPSVQLSRVSLSRSFVKRRCLRCYKSDRVILTPVSVQLRFRFGNRHGEEAAVVRVAGSFGRDKQPRGLKGFRVMYAGGGYLGLGTREEKTNERMDARRVCARILSTFFPCLSFFLAFHLPPSSAGGKYAENTPSESIYRIHTQLVFPGLGRPNQIL